MISTLHRGLGVVGQRQDLVVVILLVMAILMMILPLPTWLVDTLIAVNIASAVLLLMMALYITKPLEFSTLPSVILIITIFRLALSITTTRLILLQADAGRIVETFGQFVIAGELVVGLVVFLIITVVQFVVITKGSERVAEVSARFTLDALPGKQMAIDSDLRSGDIDQSEARSRRRVIEHESQFFGAMDGAMKFVKGDAIAGLVIVAVNLIGGIAIGMSSRGLSAGEAIDIYSLLTVGDGLAAQLPALFVSLAAGSIITRVSTDENVNLGSDITREMISSKVALRVSAVILMVLMLVPGFPWPVFLFLAAGLLAISFSEEISGRLFGRDDDDEEVDVTAELIDSVGLEKSPFVLRIAEGILHADERNRFAIEAQGETEAVSQRLGIGVLPPRLIEDTSLPTGSVRSELDDVSVARFEIKSDSVPFEAEAEDLTVFGVNFVAPSAQPPGFTILHWVNEEDAAAVETQGYSALSNYDLLRRSASAIQSEYAAQCIGMQETRAALTSMAQHYPDLVSEVRDVMPLTKLAEVFRRLVDEDVPLRNQRLLLEALTEWAPKEQDPIVLTEYVRTALKRQICDSIADRDRVIPVYLLDNAVEETIRNAIRQTTVGEYLALDAPLDSEAKPAILASLDVRRFVKSLLTNNKLHDIAVLSYQDLSNEFTVTPVTTILLPSPQPG